MPEFQYTGQDGSGQTVSGKTTASSSSALADRLLEDGITPLEISEKAAAVDDFNLSRFFQRKVKPDELQLFCRQMHTLLKVGIPINIAVSRLAQTTKDKQFMIVLEALNADLNAGRTLEHALSQFPHIFSKLFVNIVKVGENTGQLDTVFLQLSDYLALEVDTKRKVKEAMRYPILVLAALIVALVVMNFLVIPNFVKMFERVKAELPLATRVLINTSYFFTHYWHVLLISLTVFTVSFNVYIKTPNGRLNWHWLLLKMPIVGWLVHRIYLSRFAKLYSLMISSGLSVLDSMSMVGEATGNAFLSSKIDSIINFIARGNTVASACTQAEFFPPLVLQMITLGEETGRLDQLLLDVSDFYDREIDYDSKHLSDMIEPIILVVMASMVLVLALGIFLPMWDMMGAAARG